MSEPLKDQLFLHIDPSTENVTFRNFQAFLQKIKDSLSLQSDSNFFSTLENIKTSFFLIRNPQDLEEITQLYIKTFPMSFIAGKTKPRHKKKWTHHEISFLTWVVSHYSFFFSKDFDHFIENDWKFISEMMPKWDMNKIRFKWFSIQKSIEQKISWTSEEDDKLSEIIKRRQLTKDEASIYKWTEIAEELNKSENEKNSTRLGKHCRERWFNHLDHTFKKGEWTQEEDYSLIKLIIKFGKKWSMISRMVGCRNENSVKNRFFALKRKYGKFYRQMPQNDKKMLLFLCEKITDEAETELETNETLKKIKRNPLLVSKKPILTVEIKKSSSLNRAMDKNEEKSPFSNSKGISSHFKTSAIQTNNLDSTQLSLNNFLLTTQTTDLKPPKKDFLPSPNESEFKSKTVFMRKNIHRSQTHSPNKMEPPQQKPIRLIDTALNADIDDKLDRNLKFSDFPNIYKNETSEQNFPTKPILFYPNKDILSIMKFHFDIIDEEGEKDDLVSKDLSQILSSLSLSDQYLAESNRILNGITFNPHNNSFSSSRIISESFNRSTSKHNTVAVTNSSEKSSNMLENLSPFLNSLAGRPQHAHNASFGMWGNQNYGTNYINYNNCGYGINFNRLPSFESVSLHKPSINFGVEAFNEREVNPQIGNDVFSMQELKEFK